MTALAWIRRQAQRRWRWLVAVVILCGAGWLALPHVRAWYHLRQAYEAMDRARPDLAAPHLEFCQRVWPDTLSVGLLSSRAARQRGDFEESNRWIRHCQRREGAESSPDVVLEWSLFQASVGNIADVDSFLQRQLERDPRLSPLVWEALADGYIRAYRILDAIQTLDHWLAIDPDSIRALSLRGLAFRLGRSAPRAIDDLRRVIEIDPGRQEDRWQLVMCLLDVGGYEEALRHLALIEGYRPDDPEVQVRQARCLHLLGRRDEADELLSKVLDREPNHAQALRTRGQIRLMQRQAEEAERWLRKAVEASPRDYLANWLLFQALTVQQKTTEASAQLKKVDEIKDRAERLGELRSRRMSENPLDPALHFEMGMLLTRSGKPDEAEVWYERALGLDAKYRPAHKALEELYRRRGDVRRAEEHAKAAQE